MTTLEPPFDSLETAFKALHTKFETSFLPCLPLLLNIEPSNELRTKIMLLLTGYGNRIGSLKAGNCRSSWCA